MPACSLLFEPIPNLVGDDTDGSPTSALCEQDDFRWAYQLAIELAGFAEGASLVPVPIRLRPQDYPTYQLPDTPDSLRLVADGQILHHEVEAWSADEGGCWFRHFLPTERR